MSICIYEELVITHFVREIATLSSCEGRNLWITFGEGFAVPGQARNVYLHEHKRVMTASPKKLKYILLCSLVLLILNSCGGNKNEGAKKGQTNQTETLIKINQYLVGQDSAVILAYLKRRNWKMNITQTGLWYMIYQKGKGKAAQTGKLVTLNYKVWLLDGTLCYSSDQLGPKKFRIGKGGVEKGLEEGILLLRRGDKARFIMPPHLAYGILGDENMIPRRSIILYDVELVQISD
jgi:FKBP-type peptidyl-prolyl cis-trans isomerase FkpA